MWIVRFHFVRDVVSRKEIGIYYVEAKLQLTDALLHHYHNNSFVSGEWLNILAILDFRRIIGSPLS